MGLLKIRILDHIEAWAPYTGWKIIERLENYQCMVMLSTDPGDQSVRVLNTTLRLAVVPFLLA